MSPTAREPKSAKAQARIQIQNRRREYLQRHPSYFDSLESELVDPVLYERLIKRFQSARERAEEGKAKGYGRTLEASLIRGESRLASIRADTTEAANTAVRDGPAIPTPDPSEIASTGLDPWDGPAKDKQGGVELWRAFLEDRFVHGRDAEFDYELVDEDESLDVLKSKDAEDQWFDEEEPSWVDESEAPAKGARAGETGVQDF